MLVVRNFEKASDYYKLIENLEEVICDGYDEADEILALNRAKEINGICVRVRNNIEDPALWEGPVVVNYLIKTL